MKQSLFLKKSILRFKQSKEKASTDVLSKESQNLKIKRNILDHKKYGQLKSIKEQINSSFYKNFVTDAQSKSIPIAKAIFNKDPKTASKEYVKTINEYRKYLKESGVGKEHVEKILHTFKILLFENMVSVIKKEVSKKVLLKQSLLSEKSKKKITIIENIVINNLFKLGFIKENSKINIRFSELNSIEGIIGSHGFDENPLDLFKNITNVYFFLKKGKRSESLNNLVKGISRKIKIKNNSINNNISINTFDKNSNHIIVHELIHSYLKRENHIYGRNEIVVEFLSNLFMKKYFNQVFVRKESTNIEYNQYYLGYFLFNEYVKKHGLDFKYVNIFLKSKESLIEKHSLR